ncbi:MAG: hypothetical protein QOI66_112, partial [Myxococcales bacterium]|nr:hypothetical protein [Myxococcales bacterium]
MDHPPPKETRAPINLRIKFRSESLDQFIDRYSIDVSRGGIFIRTREPLAVGTQLKFDFQLQDASPLMAGEGTVVWIREYDANRTGITPGMGVRFDKLTATSQPILEKILTEKGRREQGNQSGGIMSKVGAGMAVRRPSSTFTALDPRALGLVAGAPGGSGETPAGGTGTPDSVTRRERRPSAPTLPPTQPPHASPSTISSAERTHQGFASSSASPTASSTASSTASPTALSPVVNPERTHMGGFAAPGSPGYPPPMTLPSAIPQRPRTPGPLPALETPGSGRHNTGSVSRLNAPRPANYEPPTSADIDRALDGLMGGNEARPTAPAPAARPSSRVAADSHGVPGLNEDEAPSEPTKTGDALSEVVAAATQSNAAERAAAAASGVVDGAAPASEIDSDRTLATSAAQIAEMLEESARTATTPEKTAKDMPAVSETTPTPPPPSEAAVPAAGPSLVLIKNDAVAKSDDAIKSDQSPADVVGSATAEAAAAAVSANSAQSPTAAGSFTAGKLSGIAANTVGAGPDTARLPGAAAAGAAAK